MGAKDKKKMKENKKNKPKPDDGGGNNGKLITDARFASMHSDPRFSELRRKKNKVEIDSRFKHAFTDKNFAASKAPVDKRGKPKKNDAAANPLQRYYTLEDEKGRDLQEKLPKNDEESESEDEKVKLKDESEESSSSEEEVESDDSSSTSLSGSTDSDEEDVVFEEEKQEQDELKIPEIDKETHRLAVVNMDWSEVRAVDLYVLLSSFLPKGGHIVSVAVYPSESGLKRMEEEAVRGPVGLFDDDKNKNEDEESEDDDDDEIDTEKLRAYELSRLRYYFAVVECDSIATADCLYKTCDGLEFERSSLKLDLRFIPDSMEFKHQPRDVAKTVGIWEAFCK